MTVNAVIGGHMPGWESPGQSLVAVTPHDSNNITGGDVRALWVGGAGNVAILAAGDSSAVTIVGVPAGTLLPIATTRVNSTNTTATNIVGIR
jgi:hypothetical protein